MHSVSASLSSCADDDSTLNKRNQNCQATDESTGESCGETKGLHILDEFRKLYESRIENVDRISDGESDRVSMKLQIMSDWIKDLGEQNTMLVHTVEDLEQAACSRVKMLEEKLKQSSQIVVDNLTRSNNSEKALNTLSNRVNQLEKDEKYLQQKIEYLQSDIRGLLEVIRRARQQNVWSLEGITFLEIQPENIPIPIDCICSQEQTDTEHVKALNLQVEQLQENEKKMLRSQFELEEKITELKSELSMKDETIKKYISRLQCFYEKLKEHVKQTNQIISHSLITSDQDCNIILIPDILESILDAKDTENRNLRRQLQHVESKLMVHTYENNIDATNLKVQLEEKSNKVQQLEEKVAQLEKEAEKAQNTLTAEIATLEKQNYHANVGNLLKDDLIKEMRKELKEAALEKNLPTSYSPVYNSHGRVATRVTNIESVYKSSEKFPLSHLLRISTQQKNDRLYPHDDLTNVLNYGGQNVSTINAKLQNRSLSLQNHSRQRTNIQASRYKCLKNIDKKILHTARKLSPPCKDSNL